jgi:predicted Zn-dependent peptidase
MPPYKIAWRRCVAFWLSLQIAFCGVQLFAADADPLAAFPQRVHKLVLKNGMRVLYVERPSSQTVSFAMYIRTGGVDDEMGKSGLAHMFEHMLFKGTKTVGTKDYKAEAPLLDEIDVAQAALQAEQDKGAKADPAVLKTAAEKVTALTDKEESLIVPEEYWQVYERAGARNLNASTGYDFTNYTVALPLNYVKLWFTMEADRLRNPVLREFYKERSVVMEERRLRIDSVPQGKLQEAFLAAAFEAHPYGRPIVGWESDISHITRPDALDFFKRHYDVSRLVISIVGGIKGADIEAMCKTYFEPIPSQAVVDNSRIPVEPPQEGTRRVNVEFDAEPEVILGYHRPNMTDPDNAAFEAIEDILSDGRSARLNLNVVEKQKIAVSAWASASFPGERDPNLFALGATPKAPHTAADAEKALLDQIRLLQDNGPTPEELQKVKNGLEAALIRGLSSNDGLAGQLGYFEAVAGDWKYVLDLLRQVRALTAADVQRVAKTYLTPSNLTVATVGRKKP